MRSRLPVIRPRRRYLAFELEAEGPVQQRDLVSEIQSSQLSLFGEAGAARNRLVLISFDGRLGILRCSHTHLQETRAVIASIFYIGGVRAALRTKGVSGTIKTATEKYLQQLSKLSAETDGRRIEIEDVSGCIVRAHGLAVDICPDDGKGSDTRYLGLTSFDLSGGHKDADGTTDGL